MSSLQGTIDYIEELRARIDALEQVERDRATTVGDADPLTASNSSPSQPLESEAPRPPSLTTVNSYDSTSADSSSTSLRGSSATDESGGLLKEDADHAANMLLYFSTSPELRPVQM